MSFFESVQLLPDDPIFGLPAVFAADPRQKKVNLGIGVYRDAEGKSTVLNCVRKAEQILLEQKLDKDYQPIDGHADFLHESLKLIFGNSCKGIESKEIFAAQTIGGTGGLRLGSEFLAQEISKTIFISEPSWPNHKPIFTRANMAVHHYPYYDLNTHRIEFDQMRQAILAMHPGGVLLVHACCHNPTGMDLTFDQWKELSALVLKQKVVPFFDFAYQGFGNGLEEDAKPVRYFYEQGHEMLVAYSFSKNLGLYGERVGTLAIVTHHKDAAKRISTQVKQIIRGMYSTPPLHGARVAATILKSPELTAEWKQELTNMRERIKDMRKALVAGLLAQSQDMDFSFLNQQLGLFSFCGLSHDQVQSLRQHNGIFMPNNGRINVAGLNAHNMDYVIKSILSALHS